MSSCHSAVPLDDPVDISGTVTSQVQSTEPLNEAPPDPQEVGQTEAETQSSGADVILPTFPINPEYTSAKADKTGTVVTHTPRSDFFFGTTPEDSRRMQVIDATGVLQNDTYVFYRGTEYEFCKRNLTTLEETPVCCDPYCTHFETIFVSSPDDACPFNAVRSVNFLYENKIYYVRSYAVRTDTKGSAEWHDVFSSYDYMTDEYHAIEDIAIPYNTNLERGEPPHAAYQNYGHYVVYGDCAYAILYRCVNGKGDKAEDYGRVLVRLNFKTDKSEDLMPVDGLLPEKASIVAIREKSIYMTAEDGLWVWTPEEGKLRRITSIDPDYSVWWNRGSWGLDDEYAYVMTFTITGGMNPSDGIYRGIPYVCLLRIDLKTGEPVQLTDVVTDHVFMSDKAIYLVPSRGYNQITEYWRLNVNPWKESTNPHKKYMVQILKIDLDSGKTETIGYCNTETMEGSGLVLTRNGLFGSHGFFEFSTGITYTSDGEIYDDPKNGIINEPEYKGDAPDIPGGWHTGEETWW